MYDTSTRGAADLYQSASRSAADVYESGTKSASDLYLAATGKAADVYESSTKSAADLWEQATSGAASLYSNTTATAGQLKQGAIESALSDQIRRQTLGESLLRDASTGYGNASSQRLNYLNSAVSGAEPTSWINSVSGVTMNAGPNIYNKLGLTQWQQDLTDTVYNGQAAVNAANAKGQNDMVGGIIKGASSVVGAVGMAFL
jgi:hypothetical protein